jgi:hypothetical protein
MPVYIVRREAAVLPLETGGYKIESKTVCEAHV